MNVLSKVLALGALSVMAACTSNDPSALGGGFGSGANGAIAPGSPSDPRSPAYFQQTVGDRVLFTVDQSTLTPQAQTVLQGQADWLLANPDSYRRPEVKRFFSYFAKHYSTMLRRQREERERRYQDN